MNALYRLFRRSTWIALVAALFMAVLPTLSHALAFDGGGTWTEICTPQGMKIIVFDGAVDDDREAEPQAATIDHCPYCTLAATTVALPATVVRPMLVSSATAAPPAFLHAPRTLFAWASAQPRAPPVGS